MSGVLTRAESRALRMTGKTEAARSGFDCPTLYVIPSLPRNPAKRKKYNNYAPTARFFDCAVAPLRMTMRISSFLPSGIPRREHRPYGICSLL